MEQYLNQFGQHIGPPLPGWLERPPPPRAHERERDRSRLDRSRQRAMSRFGVPAVSVTITREGDAKHGLTRF
jgi:hypothetical protein